MTQEQMRQIDRTLHTVGWLAVLNLAALTFYALAVEEVGVAVWFKGLFDWDNAGFIFYPTIIVGVAAFWVRRFLRLR